MYKELETHLELLRKNPFYALLLSHLVLKQNSLGQKVSTFYSNPKSSGKIYYL